MDSSQLWPTYATFIKGIAEFFHWKFPRVLELDEKVSIAWMHAEEARKHYNPEKGTFKTYASRVVSRGVLEEINKEIGYTYKKHKKTHKVIYSTHPVAGFEGLQHPEHGFNSGINIKNQYNHSPEYVTYVTEQDYDLSDRVGAYKQIANSASGFYAWLHYVYGLSTNEISELTKYTPGQINEFLRNFRSIR